MKNKIIIVFLTLILNSYSFNYTIAKEFSFNATELQIFENGNILKAVNGGEVNTQNNEIVITADSFEYNKLTTLLKAIGNVKLIDKIEDIIIESNEIFYLKNEEKISSLGKTNINVEDTYYIEGSDIILLKDKMILSSKKNSFITDSESNTYELEQFQYSIDKEILKGENILTTTNDKKKKSDQFFFQTGFFDLKKNKFLAKDIVVNLHKDLFGNNENDPRINAVLGYGDKFNTYFEKGVFTSCKKTDKCPPWKIASKRIQHDKVKKQIIYKDAWLEIYDFPIVYFPKFFHPDPSVERQSGILKPDFGSSNNLGSSIYVPYFHIISDNKDITLKPRLFDDNKILLQSEYRQKTKNSLTITDFSITKGHDSSKNDKDDTRSHFFSNTLVDLSLDNFTSSALEINIEKTSNDNYIKLFNLESPLLLKNNNVLESIVKLDLEHENYDLTSSFEIYETLNTPNSDRYQYVLPSYDFSKNFNIKNFSGSFNFNSYGNNNLNETNTLTSLLSNDLTYESYNSFFDNGIQKKFEVLFKNINSMGKNSAKYKNSPQSELMSAYNYNFSLPLLKRNINSINSLTPKISFRLSPHEMKNNSNIDRRINVDNIFGLNRLALTDSFEAGESVTLGIDFKKEKISDESKIIEIEKYFDFKLATVLRLNDEMDIPINSTLNKKNSNVFGRFNFQPNKILKLGYDFSLTNDFDVFEYNSLNANLNYNNFNTEFNYIEETGVIGDTNVIENSTGYDFNKNSSILFSTRRNRKINLTEYYDLMYQYKNDCLVASLKYKKDYYNNADIKPVEELFFSITIIPLTTFSPSKMALN
tara:strand:- start:1267 stop:3714 length:2448 start_codon:yes stop_codon:yes gene_type:complete